MPYNKYFKYLNGIIKKPRATEYRHKLKQRLLNQTEKIETTEEIIMTSQIVKTVYNQEL